MEQLPRRSALTVCGDPAAAHNLQRRVTMLLLRPAVDDQGHRVECSQQETRRPLIRSKLLHGPRR